MRQMSGEDSVPLNESERTRQRFMERTPFVLIRGLYQPEEKNSRDGVGRPHVLYVICYNEFEERREITWPAA